MDPSEHGESSDLPETLFHTEYVGSRNGRRERHGHGCWKASDGRIYVGDWRCGKRHGQGEMTYSNGNKYFGSYADGMRHGHGVFIEPEGSKYEGEWCNGLMHGSGAFWSAARRDEKRADYEGQFSDGSFHGEGVLRRNFGSLGPSIYCGQFVKGKMHGFGRLRTDGHECIFFSGRWEDGLLEGDGYCDDGHNVFKGQFHRHRRHGHGCLTTRDQRIVLYAGKWCDDRPCSFNWSRIRYVIRRLKLVHWLVWRLWQVFLILSLALLSWAVFAMIFASSNS